MPNDWRSRRLIDRRGKRFGFLVVVKRKQIEGDKHTYWQCNCDCGKIVTICSESLTSGRTRSCGCFNSQRTIERLTRHGHATTGGYTKEYRAWLSMKSRCKHKGQQNYSYYGGRGIFVCERWIHSFVNFLSDMGIAPSKEYSLDRINPFGNYEPTNCRWATKSTQSQNTRKAHMNQVSK